MIFLVCFGFGLCFHERDCVVIWIVIVEDIVVRDDVFEKDGDNVLEYFFDASILEGRGLEVLKVTVVVEELSDGLLRDGIMRVLCLQVVSR